MLVIIPMTTCDSEPLGGATSIRCSWHWPKVHQPLPGLAGGLVYWTQCERYSVSSVSPGIGGSYIWAVAELPKALDIELILFLILSSDKTSDSFALKFLGGSWLTTRLWCRVCLFHTESNSSYLWWCEKYADFLQWKKCGTICPSVVVTLTQMAPPYLLWRKKVQVLLLITCLPNIVLYQWNRQLKHPSMVKQNSSPFQTSVVRAKLRLHHQDQPVMSGTW